MLTGVAATALAPLLLLVMQVLTQVQGVQHQGLTRLLASHDQGEQQELLGLYYPLLQEVVDKGDVGAVAGLIQDISHSLC
jgi:hypothetical protein